MPIPQAAVVAGRVARDPRVRRIAVISLTVTATLTVLVALFLMPPLPITPPDELINPPATVAGRVAAAPDRPVLGIPAVAYHAIILAAQGSTVRDCTMRWQMLGGVMGIESGYGTYSGDGIQRTITPAGDVTPPIFGPALAPGSGFAVIANDDYGRTLGVTTAYAKAVGPTQFLPGTWRAYGRDGNGDGTADPQNLYDAAAATVAYLCASGYQEGDTAATLRALWAYNPSAVYAAQVLERAATLDVAAALLNPIVPQPAGTIVTVRGIDIDGSIAVDLERMLAAAAVDGIELGGYGWRSTDTQVALRRAHCGTSHYAIYEMPSGDCSPPTATPGQSMHEKGLAVDFYDQAGTLTVGSAGFRWLAEHAGRYGFCNLPSEAWHWSPTCT